MRSASDDDRENVHAGKSNEATLPSRDAGVVSADAGAPISDPSAPGDPGKGDGSDVVTLGDSWMSNTLQLEGTGGGISPSLVAVSKQPYPNYAVQGVMELSASLFGPAIPTQWDAATAAHKTIKTVIMTGGGNDIIQNSTLSQDCTNGGAMCDATLEQIAQSLKALWKKMVDAGVRDIIHIEYSNNTSTHLKNAAANAQRLQTICDAVPLPARCHLVATDALVGNDLAIDGIHPVQSANDRMAAAVYKLMEDQQIRR